MRSLNEKISLDGKMMKYLQIFIDLVFLLGHFKGGGTSPQVGGFHEKSPEIAFSDRVDAVLKNLIENYYFFVKLQPPTKGFFIYSQISGFALHSLAGGFRCGLIIIIRICFRSD